MRTTAWMFNSLFKNKQSFSIAFVASLDNYVDFLARPTEMKRLSRNVLFMTLFTLTACSATGADKIEPIRQMQIPLVQPNDSAAKIPLSQLASLYQYNHQHISTLSASIKTRYLQEVKPKEIFEHDNDVQRVYAALSKLEELQMMNEHYFTERNETGLRKIENALSPLIRG
ncbi:hypothetical protein [Citrobacter sedlakii]|uniref:hypothetical protein n=2 Tax=Enterobacteriaceae TaxID=543 RepID=UPI003334C678